MFVFVDDRQDGGKDDLWQVYDNWEDAEMELCRWRMKGWPCSIRVDNEDKWQRWLIGYVTPESRHMYNIKGPWNNENSGLFASGEGGAWFKLTKETMEEIRGWASQCGGGRCLENS